METFTKIFLSMHVLFWIFLLGALVYFIVKRMEAKKEERFEKRDN